MEDLTGKWGGTNLYNILQANETEFVHPDDWAVLKAYPYIRSLHQCVGLSMDYLHIAFGDFRLRIKTDVFHPLSAAPEFLPFQKVKLHNSKGQLEFGSVAGIHWHNNTGRFYYDIEVNSKVKGRKLYAEDLESAEA